MKRVVGVDLKRSFAEISVLLFGSPLSARIKSDAALIKLRGP